MTSFESSVLGKVIIKLLMVSATTRLFTYIKKQVFHSADEMEQKPCKKVFESILGTCFRIVEVCFSFPSQGMDGTSNAT